MTMTTHNIFKDLKVAEFAWVGVGSLAGKMLAGWGATVVKNESLKAPCPLRTFRPFKENIPGLNRSGFFNMTNPNKYSLSLNLKSEKGQEVAKKLIQWADVVSESYAPGTMDSFGLGYEDAKKINPEVIYYSTCMQGQTGPHCGFRGFGTHLAALSGYVDTTGWPDREPVGIHGPYTDSVAMYYGQALVLGALEYRRRTGKGTYIDLSQLEAGAHFMGPSLLDTSVNNANITRNGNRSDRFCPNGAFPCTGKDRWVAISVADDAEWKRLCEAMEMPELAEDQRFSTMTDRKKNEDALEEIIGQWSENFSSMEVSQKLQKADIAAAPVAQMPDLYSDPQLKERNSFIPIEHPEIGTQMYRPTMAKLSKTPEEMRMPAPCLGEHNEFVLQELLHMSEDEVTELIVAGGLE